MDEITSKAYQCNHFPRSTSCPVRSAMFLSKISEHASFIGSSSLMVLIEKAFATGRFLALWIVSSLTLNVVEAGPAGVLMSNKE
jgi:hypothetical protein